MELSASGGPAGGAPSVPVPPLRGRGGRSPTRGGPGLPPPRGPDAIPSGCFGGGGLQDSGYYAHCDLISLEHRCDDVRAQVNSIVTVASPATDVGDKVMAVSILDLVSIDGEPATVGRFDFVVGSHTEAYSAHRIGKV